jgi:hypothetical protein
MTNDMILAIVVQSIIFAIGLFKIYTDMQLKLRELDLRLTQVEKVDNDMTQSIKRIETMIIELRLEMKDKANKNA